MDTHSLALYGVTGDLAAKMLLPALARLMQRDGLRLRVIGIGHAPLEAGQALLPARKNLLDEHPEFRHGFDALAGSFEYIAGDLDDAAIYRQLGQKLGDTQRPLHYLAIPPRLFEPVVTHLSRQGLTAHGARIAVEKPFGHDLASASALQAMLARAFTDPQAIFRIDHFLGKHSIRNLSDMRARSPVLRQVPSNETTRSVQLTMAETFGIAQRGAFYESVGAIRDVFQNHLLQLLAVIAMAPVPPNDKAAFETARIDAMKAIRPLRKGNVVLGQYEGYGNEPHVAPLSRTPTYIAARLHVDSPRCAGVPFLVRAGKRTAVTATTASFALRGADASRMGSSNDHLRFRLGPGKASIAWDTQQLASFATFECAPLLLSAELPDDSDHDAYMNVLRAVLAGDHSVSEQPEGVDAAWRVVEEILDADLPVHPYARGSWGPDAANALLDQNEHWWNVPA